MPKPGNMKNNPMLASIEAKIRAEYQAKLDAIEAEIREKVQAEYQMKFDASMDMLAQLCCDVAFIAANRVFQMGEKRSKQFCDVLVEELDWAAALIDEDKQADKDYIYAKAKIDERLKQICGENFQPWEVRYGRSV